MTLHRVDLRRLTHLIVRVWRLPAVSQEPLTRQPVRQPLRRQESTRRSELGRSVAISFPSSL
jgi:hypothetical protein